MFPARGAKLYQVTYFFHGRGIIIIEMQDLNCSSLESLGAVTFYAQYTDGEIKMKNDNKVEGKRIIFYSIKVLKS